VNELLYVCFIDMAIFHEEKKKTTNGRHFYISCYSKGDETKYEKIV